MQPELHVQCNMVKQMPGGIRITHIVMVMVIYYVCYMTVAAFMLDSTREL